MKRSDQYHLTTIHNTPFLLPYGQNAADLRHAVRLNATGAFLWNELAEDISRGRLLRAFQQFCHASDQELPELEQDLDEFLAALQKQNLLETSNERSESHWRDLMIGGLRIRLNGPVGAFSEALLPFAVPYALQSAPDQQILVHDSAPSGHRNGTVLLRSPDLIVMQTGQEYLLLFPSMSAIEEAHLSFDGTIVHVYCRLSGLPDKDPGADEILCREMPTEEERKCRLPSELPPAEQIFHALRMLYLYRAQLSGIYAIHSASILYRGHVWLFSAPSGTGKSTHANLWKALADSPILNGDLNLIAVRDGLPVVYGLPWCGTSGIAVSGSWALGGIFLLRQYPSDFVCTLSVEDQILSVMRRIISPVWTARQTEDCCSFTEQLSDLIMIRRLFCTKNPSAQECCRREIDRYILEKEAEKK